jgi:hypothetical protein
MAFPTVQQIINRDNNFTLAQKRVLRDIFRHAFDNVGQDLAIGPGTGITAGTGTKAVWNVVRGEDVVVSTLFVDLTGLRGSTTDLDIIGVTAAANCHLGQIEYAKMGTLFAGEMRCIEVPAGGVTDIDLYSATESTGVEDAAVTGLVEAAMVTSGAVWTAGRSLPFISIPANGKYLYLANGAGAVPGTFTAGQFELRFFGTP